MFRSTFLNLAYHINNDTQYVHEIFQDISKSHFILPLNFEQLSLFCFSPAVHTHTHTPHYYSNEC